MREEIHERIRAKIQHEAKMAEVMAEEMLDALPSWNEVPDLMMETKDGGMIPEAAAKQKRDELAGGRRKQQREECIRQEKGEHSPMVSWRTRNPVEFYSEDWDELQQQDDKWQVPDKRQRISQMVFYGGFLYSEDWDELQQEDDKWQVHM